VLGSDPHDGLAAALGRLGRVVMGAKANKEFLRREAAAKAPLE
jgi:hypothetical protein